MAAEQNQRRPITAAFPTPPPFYHDFTAKNISRLQHIKKETGLTTDTSVQSSGLPSLPSDLQNLIPPEPPADGRYKSFGITHDLNQIDQSLTEAGILELYPASQNGTEAQPDPTQHLQTITRAILLNFLELVGILSVNPEHYADKIQHLQTLFYNAHDLINQYRPHQARESLILMMEDQLDTNKQQIEGVKQAKEKMVELLRTIQSQGGPKQAIGGVNGLTNGTAHDMRADESERREAQRAQWALLDEELG